MTKTAITSDTVTYIYGLFDPRAGCALRDVRYIGKSVNPVRRLAAHLAPCNISGEDYRCRWFRKLVREGVRPLVRVLEQTTEARWAARERFWIARARALGAPLTNTADGGNGSALTGSRRPVKTRRRIAHALRGNRNAVGYRLTPEHKAAIAAKNRINSLGNKNSVGRAVSAETRDKLRRAMTGKRMPPSFWDKRSLLTEDDVRQIRARLDNGERVCAIAPDFSWVSKHVLYDIKCRRHWRHVV